MMALKEYLEQTEKAAQQLFSSLTFYKELIQEAVGPTFVGSASDVFDLTDQYRQWSQENAPALQYASDKFWEYDGVVVSHTVLCGAILQIAFTGIEVFSQNKEIPDSCSPINLNTKAVKFCVGREVSGLPLGLIIYAGRHQHVHADEEEKLHQVNRKVFNCLAGRNNQKTFFDTSKKVSLAHNVLAIAGWKNYDSYRADMHRILDGTAGQASKEVGIVEGTSDA